MGGNVARGRPIKSLIRERMQQIVDALGVSYGYEIYKVYEGAFSPIDLRSMYYHLRKGVELDEFALVGMKEEKGAFTWGDFSLRRYYVLGPAAEEKANDDLHIIVKTLGLGYREPKDYVDWVKFLKEKAQQWRQEFVVITKTKKPNLNMLEGLDKKIISAVGWFRGKKIEVKELDSLHLEIERFLTN